MKTNVIQNKLTNKNKNKCKIIQSCNAVLVTMKPAGDRARIELVLVFQIEMNKLKTQDTLGWLCPQESRSKSEGKK